MNLEQERRSSVHAATDLKGYDRTVSDNTIDDKLVGHGLGDQFAGFLDRDMVALAHDECGKLAKFAETIAQRIDRMTAGDRQQVGAVREIGLVGTVYGGSPIRGTADYRRRENPADIAVSDEVLGVVDRRRYLTL